MVAQRDIIEQVSTFVEDMFSPDSVTRNAALNTRLAPDVTYKVFPVVEVHGSTNLKHYLQLMSLFHNSFEIKTIVHEDADESGACKAAVDMSVVFVPFSIFKIIFITLPIKFDFTLDSSSTNDVDDEKSPGWLIDKMDVHLNGMPRMPAAFASLVSIFVSPIISYLLPLAGALILHLLYLYNHYLTPNPTPTVPYLNFRWFVSQVLIFSVSIALWAIRSITSITSSVKINFVLNLPSASNEYSDDHLSTLKPSGEKRTHKKSYTYKPKVPAPKNDAGTVSYASAVTEGPKADHHTLTGSNGGHPKEVHLSQEVPEVEAGTVSYAKAVEEGERESHHQD